MTAEQGAMPSGPGTLAALRAELEGLYVVEGSKAYGLHHLNQVQHALQSAARAEDLALSPALIIACLIHDVGHMVHDLGEAPAEHGVDDQHELRGAEWAATRLLPEVSEPIRLHVSAKRWLYGREPTYFVGLSGDSRLSLSLQGGPMTPAEQEIFLGRRFAQDAITLRRIDDLAKDPAATTPGLDHFLETYLAAALA